MLNTRTIVTGAVTLGAPLYIKGELQGRVCAYFKPNTECGLEFIEVFLEDVGYKLCVIENENSIYIPYDVLPIDLNDSNIELWCGYHGLIGAGDINDDESIYYRVHGDTKVRVDPKTYICETYLEENLTKDENEKWSCPGSASMQIKLDFYQNDELKYLIPVALYQYDSYKQKYVDVYKISVYYCNKYSLTNLF